jgi:drug/metabolite transporter (DMT)-like permease
VVAIVAAAMSLRARWVPRRPIEWWGLGAGVLASLAVLGFLAATDRGLLTVSAVLTSLYPAATVLLAMGVLRERVHRAQAVGLGMCVVTVVCVALG